MELTKEIENRICVTVESMRNSAYSLTRNKDDVDDLLQDVAVSAITKISSFEETEPLDMKRWIYTIMRNKFINNYRKKKYENTITSDNILETQDSYSHMDSLDNKSVLSHIDDELLIGQAQGFTYEELSKEFNLPLGTIRSKIHHARKNLVSVLIYEGMELNDLPASAAKFFDSNRKVNKKSNMNKEETAANKAFIKEQIKERETLIKKCNYEIHRLINVLSIIDEPLSSALVINDHEEPELVKVKKKDKRSDPRTESARMLEKFMPNLFKELDAPLSLNDIIYHLLRSNIDIKEQVIRNWISRQKINGVMFSFRKLDHTLNRNSKVFQLKTWSNKENLEKHKLIIS